MMNGMRMRGLTGALATLVLALVFVAAMLVVPLMVVPVRYFSRKSRVLSHHTMARMKYSQLCVMKLIRILRTLAGLQKKSGEIYLKRVKNS